MKKYSICISVCFCFLLNLYAQENSINRRRLPNGITLIHKQNKANDVVAIDIFMRGGQRNEPDTQAGIAMLAQSLVTQGTKTRSAQQIAAEIEFCGGSLSAGASEDYLSANVLVTAESVETGFELLADVVINPVFPYEEFEKEEKVQQNAIRTRDEDISTTASDVLLSQLYPHHSYGRPMPGRTETLEKITRDDVAEWYNHQAQPDQAILVVVGNCSLEKVSMLVEKYFGAWKTAGRVRPLVMPVVVEPLAAEIIKTIPREFKQSFLLKGYHAPCAADTDYTALKLLNEILGGGMSTRLFQKFREEKPYVYSVGCYYPTRIETSRFVFYMGLDKQNIDDAKKELSGLIEDLHKNPISNEELSESKTHLIGTYRMAHQSNQSQAWYLGWWETVGRGYEYDERYVHEIQQITAEDVHRIALKYLNKSATITIQGTP